MTSKSQSIVDIKTTIFNHPLVKEVDNNDELRLLCYPSTVGSEKLNSDTILQASRGVVVIKKTGKILLPSFHHTSEFTLGDPNLENILSDNVLNTSSIFPSLEGTLIRVFYHNKWYISTHRKLDAFKSKWGCKRSYGEFFEDAVNKLGNTLDEFKESLNKDKQYLFLMRNDMENRIVSICEDENKLYHVGTYVNGKLEMNTETVTIVPPVAPLQLKTREDIVEFVTKHCDPKELQGVVIFTNENAVKVISGAYNYLKSLRGNEQSVKFRYLQLRTNLEMNNDLRNLYREWEPVFDEYENTIFEVCQKIYKAYVKRYILKEHVVVPKEEFYIMKLCHAWHMEDRNLNKIRLDKVIEVFNENLKPPCVNRIIKRVLHKKRTEESDDMQVE